jgi:hypothetical protein
MENHMWNFASAKKKNLKLHIRFFTFLLSNIIMKLEVTRSQVRCIRMLMLFGSEVSVEHGQLMSFPVHLLPSLPEPGCI